MFSVALRRALPLAAALAFAVLSPAAHADTKTYSVVLTTASPTYNRPLTGSPPTGLSSAGSNVYYNLQPFFVNLSSTYTLQTTAATLTGTNPADTFIVLYQTSFNPSTPLVNVLQADDDTGGTNGLSIITRALTANTQYYLVTTTFTSGVTGNITSSIGQTGAGVVTLGAVGAATAPEPGSAALLLVAGVPALGLVRRRKARV